ncbi:MAG: HEPN domain-containing protein [Candidatus Rokubacteria bacterium]|nr:HEPN domain-containing protein [Candidatus Rokubacteria bacterium]
MSRLLQQNGDDHPEAAQKHLNDASVLNGGGRADGASYLAGYVVECSLKALLQHETGIAPLWHDLKKLASRVSAVCAVAGAKTARYLAPAVLSLPAGAIAAWDPEMRYRAPSMTGHDAAAWLREAQSIYQATVGQMFLDGVI